MSWDVQFYDAFDAEFEDLPEAVQDELLAHARLLEQFGPQLGRPRVDTLNGSDHANMKELRFDADDGVWRVAFAFDPRRKAILLVCGDKSGGSEKRFYKQLLKKADERFDDHLSKLSREGQKVKGERLWRLNLHDKMKSVGSKRRKKIEVRVAELVAEEMALRELRKSLTIAHRPVWQNSLALARTGYPGLRRGAISCFQLCVVMLRQWVAIFALSRNFPTSLPSC